MDLQSKAGYSDIKLKKGSSKFLKPDHPQTSEEQSNQSLFACIVHPNNKFIPSSRGVRLHKTLLCRQNLLQMMGTYFFVTLSFAESTLPE